MSQNGRFILCYKVSFEKRTCPQLRKLKFGMYRKRLLSPRKLLKTLLCITVTLRVQFPSKACHTFTRNQIVTASCKGIDATVCVLEYWTNTVPGKRNINRLNRGRKYLC